MKLTKKRLKQIIKEELDNIQNESAAFMAADAAVKGKGFRKSDNDMASNIERDVQDMVSYIKQKLNPEAIDALMQQLAGAAGEKTMRENMQGADYSNASNDEVFEAATKKNDPDAWQEMVHRVAMRKMEDPWQQTDEEGYPMNPYDPAWGGTASEYRQ